MVSAVQSLHEPDADILTTALGSIAAQLILLVSSSAESSMVSALSADWIRLRRVKPRHSSNYASSF